jgi:hypothetical protein
MKAIIEMVRTPRINIGMYMNENIICRIEKVNVKDMGIYAGRNAG